MQGGKRVAIYARVSTTDQTTENQLLDLRQYCSHRGWNVVQEFKDDGFSGAQKDRPALNQLMAFVRARHCDRVLVWRFDRFARSSTHLVNALEYFRERNIDFASFQEGVDTGTTQGKMFYTIIAAIAEFERQLIIERIHSGLRRARSQGKRLGRPGLSKSQVNAILALRGKGSIRSIAARVGVGHSVVHKVLSIKPIQIVASPIDETPVASSRGI